MSGANESYGLIQVVVPPGFQETLKELLAARGLYLYPIPVEGGDLPTYGIGLGPPGGATDLVGSTVSEPDGSESVLCTECKQPVTPCSCGIWWCTGWTHLHNRVLGGSHFCRASSLKPIASVQGHK